MVELLGLEAERILVVWGARGCSALQKAELLAKSKKGKLEATCLR